MTPLDLRIAPPRPGRVQLDGLVFMPRTIDKLRAQAAGGNIGAYKLSGLSEVMCTMVGISVDHLRSVVHRMATDDAAAGWLRANADVAAYERWNTWLYEHVVPDADLASFQKQYPIMLERPELRNALEILAADDARSFPASEQAAHLSETR